MDILEAWLNLSQRMEPYTMHKGRLVLKGLPFLEGLGSNIWGSRWEPPSQAQSMQKFYANEID
jgi:hypothetical protein